MTSLERWLPTLAEVATEERIDRRRWDAVVEPLLSMLDEEAGVTAANLHIHFRYVPTASDVARTLDEVDREARRVVAAFERGVRPNELRGRGVRLVPTSHGLQVEEANRGSLDLVLLFGGLYQAMTSQPLSFTLNFAASLGYGRAVIRKLTGATRGQPSEIKISLPFTTTPSPATPGTEKPAPPGDDSDGPRYELEPRFELEPHHEDAQYGTVSVPTAGAKEIRVRVKSGETEIEVEFLRDDAT